MNVLNECTENDLGILRKIAKKSNMSQRIMAEELGFSLGKLNYCLKQLKRKGLIKINNFRKNKKKINYIYILTPKGITSKTILTLNFMRKKIEEYNQLKSEIKNHTKKKLDYKLL
jgi:EPS-associated MarR family transcriptional regulator